MAFSAARTKKLLHLAQNERCSSRELRLNTTPRVPTSYSVFIPHQVWLFTSLDRRHLQYFERRSASLCVHPFFSSVGTYDNTLTSRSIYIVASTAEICNLICASTGLHDTCCITLWFEYSELLRVSPPWLPPGSVHYLIYEDMMYGAAGLTVPCEARGNSVFRNICLQRSQQLYIARGLFLVVLPGSFLALHHFRGFCQIVPRWFVVEEVLLAGFNCGLSYQVGRVRKRTPIFVCIRPFTAIMVSSLFHTSILFKPFRYPSETAFFPINHFSSDSLKLEYQTAWK